MFVLNRILICQKRNFLSLGYFCVPNDKIETTKVFQNSVLLKTSVLSLLCAYMLKLPCPL